MFDRRRKLALVVATAAVLIVAFLLASAPRPPLVEVLPAPVIEVTMGPAPESPAASAQAQELDLPPPDGDPIPWPKWLPTLLRALVFGAMLLAVAWFLRRLWQARIRERLATAGAPSGEGVEVVDLAEDQFAETLVDAAAHLRRGIPVEGAVIECWRRLEILAAETGIRRRPAQTSQEFTVEVLSRSSADPAALSGLAELYRQAMFSTHALGDDDRERAIASLEALAGQLKAAP